MMLAFTILHRQERQPEVARGGVVVRADHKGGAWGNLGGTRDFSEYDHRCDIHIAMLYICPCRDVAAEWTVLFYCMKLQRTVRRYGEIGPHFMTAIQSLSLLLDIAKISFSNKGNLWNSSWWNQMWEGEAWLIPLVCDERPAWIASEMTKQVWTTSHSHTKLHLQNQRSKDQSNFPPRPVKS